MNNGLFKKGNPRPPGAGRRAGTPNKRTQTVIEIVEASGKNPIAVILDLLDHSDPNIKLSAAKAVCEYIYPKRKHLDIDASTASVVIPHQTVTDDQLLMLVERARAATNKPEQ